jgi:MOSC domain-containing protein YiiM
MFSAASVLAVCRVAELRPDDGILGVTAIDKRPVAVRVAIKPTGVYGDVQADREHHGGLYQAVYAYAQDDAHWWAAQLGREIPPGLFGENLRTAGVAINDALIGERWRVGPDLVLEATGPRIPCATFARRMDEARWVKRFSQAARIGAYFRVVNPGTVGAGDEIVVVHRPDHTITVRDVFQAQGKQARALAATLAEHVEDLHPKIQARLA